MCQLVFFEIDLGLCNGYSYKVRSSDSMKFPKVFYCSFYLGIGNLQTYNFVVLRSNFYLGHRTPMERESKNKYFQSLKLQVFTLFIAFVMVYFQSFLQGRTF